MSGRHSFDKLAYNVPATAKEVLIHAGMHALMLPRQSSCNPGLGRILLQTGAENSGKYQEAVAAALAEEMQVRHELLALHPVFGESSKLRVRDGQMM